jgi:4-hydroxy-tetrahydrodipicolinate reductase
MIKVGIVGGTGKLGKDILGLLLDHEEMEVGAVITRRNNKYVGGDAGALTDNRTTGITVTDDILAAKDCCDLFIDCTNAQAFMEDNYGAYVLTNKPVIVATTGFNAQDTDKIARLAQSAAVVICPNFSIGVFQFLKLVRLAAREFGIHSDIDIFDYHHKMKKDKPSGTALKIRDAIQDTGLETPIAIHSVRAGHMIGEHSVLFTTEENERIELSHKIYSREGFSRGVITAIKWINQRETGLYGLEDIFT